MIKYWFNGNVRLPYVDAATPCMYLAILLQFILYIFVAMDFNLKQIYSPIKLVSAKHSVAIYNFMNYL